MSSASVVGSSNEIVDKLDQYSNFEKRKELKDFSEVSTDGQVSLALVNAHPEESSVVQPVEDIDEDEKLEGWKRYVGIMCALGSTLMFSFNQVILKRLVVAEKKEINIFKKEINPLNLGLHLFVVCSLLNLPFLIVRLLYTEASIFAPFCPFNEHKWLLVLSAVRGVGSCGSFILFFYALRTLDVGDAVVIVSSAPVFVYILGWIFLKEKIGIIVIFTAILALSGVVVIMRPPFLTGETYSTESANLIMGSLFSLVGTFGVSIGIVSLRALKHVHHSVLNFIMYLVGVIICVVAGLAPKHLTLIFERKEVYLLFGAGCMTLLGQLFLVLALEFERAGVIALIRTFGVVLAFLWQYVFPPHKPPDALSILGSAMILTGVIITIFQKWLMSLPEEHRYRRKFRYLLK